MASNNTPIVTGLACAFCNACTPVRINLGKMSLSKSKRKLLSKGKAIVRDNGIQRYEDVLSGPITADRLQIQKWHELHKKYYAERHPGSDTELFHTPSGLENYARFKTHFLEFHDKNTDQQLAIAYIMGHADGLALDRLEHHAPKRSGIKSAGTYCILRALELAQQQGLSYVYLGTWVGQGSSLEYKRNFSGVERYDHEKGWIDFLQDEPEPTGPDYTSMIQAAAEEMDLISIDGDSNVLDINSL